MKHPYLAISNFVVGGIFCGFTVQCIIYHLWAAAALSVLGAFVFIRVGLNEVKEKEKES